MREEDIIKASVTYNEVNNKLRVIGGDRILNEKEYLSINKNPDFIAGAIWMQEQQPIIKDKNETENTNNY